MKRIAALLVLSLFGCAQEEFKGEYPGEAKLRRDTERALADGYERRGESLVKIEFVDIKTTEWPKFNTKQLGEKYPHISVEGVPLDYDPAQKWFVTHYDHNGWEKKNRRVMWMGAENKDGSKTVMLMNKLDRKDTGREYDLTADGWKDAGPITHPLPTPPKVEKKP